MTGPNVMVPSAGMRIWGSSNTSPEPVTDTPSETTGKRKYDATEVRKGTLCLRHDVPKADSDLLILGPST